MPSMTLYLSALSLATALPLPDTMQLARLSPDFAAHRNIESTPSQSLHFAANLKSNPVYESAHRVRIGLSPPPLTSEFRARVNT